MIELYENLSQKEADLCSLVLKASFIPHRVKKHHRGFAIFVDEHHFDAARHTVEQYFMENRMTYTLPDAAPPDADHGYAGIWIAAFLAAIHFYVQGTGAAADFWQNFGASAARINDGEWFRTITALFLHADSVHLVGNMAGMAIFGTAVSQVAGWGVGCAMVLLAGASGNMVNAFMYQDSHLSIGASTAVFGAVGILSAYQFVRRRKSGGEKSRPWLPVLGGIALLGILGGAAHVDLGAHLFGFLGGMLVGSAYALYGSGLINNRNQWIFGLCAAGLVVFSWLIGYLYA
ncbi:MAG: rhomboid family intramembrane serine protease [Desulfosalsimonadaceae bacterium]